MHVDPESPQLLAGNPLTCTGHRFCGLSPYHGPFTGHDQRGDQYARGGYETSVSFYGAGSGACLVDGASAGVKAMKSGKRSQ